MVTMTEQANKPVSSPAPAKGVLVTDKALTRIRSAMAKEGISPEQGGLRLGVQGGGCSGLSYNIRFDTQLRERDRIFQFCRSQIIYLPARHDPGLSGDPHATGLRICKSERIEVLRVRHLVLRLGVRSPGPPPHPFLSRV